MTSDGISTADWDRVHSLAVEIANNSSEDDEVAGSKATAALMMPLDELDQTYGLKPSLLATRADYVELPELRESLLQLAYSESERIGDTVNAGLVAHSLAEFYIVETMNLVDGAAWLETWAQCPSTSTEADDRDELARLEALVKS